MKITSLVILSLIIGGTACAGQRASVDYSILTDTADDGGRSTTSAAYKNDGSLGGIVGIATVAAPAETAKSGYIAQLYEATGPRSQAELLPT